MLKRYLTLFLLLCLMLAACGPAEPESSASDAVAAEEHGDEEHGGEDEDHDDEDHDDHGDEDDDHDDHDHSNEGGELMLPELAAASLDGRALRVVATTSIVGDVVANIGGDSIDLTVLMGAGQDPHGYEATPQDLVAMEEADVIFVNGWDLEERLAESIEENFDDKYVAISAGIEPIEFGGEHGHDDEHGDEHDEDEDHEEGEEHDDEHADEDEHAEEDDHDDDHAGHDHSGADPHVWFDIHHGEQWAENAASVLSTLDPANAANYEGNLAAYAEELEALEEELETIVATLPMEKRQLVTNHDALGYFAAAYDFDIVGTVIPSLSTNAEPSAGELAELIDAMQDAGVCTIFGETTDSNTLAETVAAELNDCENVQVVTIFTGALGEGEASSYIGMLRSNMESIVAGLQ